MLADIILNIIYSVIAGFINLLPNVSLSDNLITSIANLNAYVSGLNFILPVDTLIAIVGLFLTLEGLLLTISGVNWFIRKIPTIN